MAKLRHVLWFVVVTVLWGCYDYECLDIGTLRDITQRFDAEGKAWLTLSISLSQPSELTRATSDAFSDGDEDEHIIKTLTLIFFHGAETDAEDELTVANILSIDYKSVKQTDSQVTSHSGTTIQISRDNLVAGDRLCLLAIANMTPDVSIGQTFASVKNQKLNSLTTTIDDKDYFIMTNSPIATYSEGNSKVFTLVEVSPDDLFPTAEEAQLHPVCYVFLERAAARLTVAQTVSPMVIQGNTNISFTEDDMRFGLYKYNQKCYLVRHFESQWLSYNAGGRSYRFMEQAALPTGKYRTYWAQDANYDGTGDKLSTIKGWKEMGENYYLAENTFDTGHMTDENTTSAVIYLRLNGGNAFYTASTTGCDVIYQLPENDFIEDGTSANSTFARQQSSSSSPSVHLQSTSKSPKVSTATSIDDYLREWLMQTNKSFRQWVNDYAGGEPRHVNIAVETAGDGLMTARVTAVTQTARTSGQGIDDFVNLNLVDYLNSNISLSYYHEGRCFYHIPIRHFNDELTPWQSPTTATNNSAGQAYGDNANDYLGRYGVVRNNWYVVNITGVCHVGSPVAPDAASTANADDHVEQLLNATLTITGWNSQSKELR